MTRAGASASQRPSARTWAPIWDPAAGGRICGGRLVCPFHGYEFDATGQCVATPFADPPKTARLRVFETQEVLGLIFAWWGIGGRPPQWSLPPDPPDQAGWSAPEIWATRFPGHPQETTENSVDLAHLRYVHGYGNVEPIGKMSVDGPCLESRFDFRRTRTFAKIATLTFDLSASTRVFGMGYSLVEVREHSIGMDMRLWVLATPVDGTLIDLSLVSQVWEIRNPRRWFAGLGFLPLRLRAPIMSKFLALQQHRDVCRMWLSGAANSTDPARASAVPTARSCPIEPIAPSSIPIRAILRAHSPVHLGRLDNERSVWLWGHGARPPEGPAAGRLGRWRYGGPRRPSSGSVAVHAGRWARLREQLQDGLR